MDNHNILIVEDHQGVRQSLREWLQLSFPQYHLVEAEFARVKRDIEKATEHYDRAIEQAFSRGNSYNR